jgi:hypothetical protein
MNSEVAAAPLSGRRRQASGSAGTRRRASPARLIAVVVVLAGIAFLLVGALKATVFAPSATTVGTLSSPKQPIVSTAVGLLDLAGPRLEVTATSTGARPVFVGIGRARDVDAYLAEVARQLVVGRAADGKLITHAVGSQATLPDPAAADVWVVSSRAVGSASLVWPNAGGQWRLVVATDGTAAAPDKTTLTWSGQATHTIAPALIAIGIVLTVGALITLVMLGARDRLAGDS